MDLIHGCRILFSFLFVTVTSFSFRPYKNNLTRYFGNKEKGRAIILEWNYCPHSWLTFRDMPWVQLVLNVAVIVLHQFTNGGWSICCYDDNADTPLKEVVKTPLKPNHLHHHRTARFCNRENNIVWSKYVSAFSIQWTAHRVGAVLHSCALIYLNQLKMNDFFSGIILKRICAIDIELTCGTSSPESGDGVAPKPWDKKKKKRYKLYNTNKTIQIMHLKRSHCNTYHRLFPYRRPCQIRAGQWRSCLWWFGCLLWTCQNHDQAGGPTTLMWCFFRSSKFGLNRLRNTSFTFPNSKSGENSNI